MCERGDYLQGHSKSSVLKQPAGCRTTEYAETSRIIRSKYRIANATRRQAPQRVDQLDMSDQNPLDLIQADGIIGAVIQLRRTRRLVIRGLLRVLVTQLPLRVTRAPLEDTKRVAVVLLPLTGY